MSKKQGTTKEDVPHTAVKFDTGKVMTHLFPVRAYLETSKVFTYGMEKYAEGNWKAGHSFNHSRLISACQRHISAIQLGERLDPESGLPHAAHAICCLAMLLELQIMNHGTDDLSKSQIHIDAKAPDKS